MSSLIPDMEDLKITHDELMKSFDNFSGLEASPGSTLEANLDYIALNNSAANRMSGGPLMYNNNAIGILTGSFPLDGHNHAIRISALANISLDKANNYIHMHSLSRFFPSVTDTENIKIYCYAMHDTAYRTYYQENPNGLRHNLCLLDGSVPFKSCIAITRILEAAIEHFNSMYLFIEFIKKSSPFILCETFNDFACLTPEAVLNQEININSSGAEGT